MEIEQGGEPSGGKPHVPTIRGPARFKAGKPEVIRIRSGGGNAAGEEKRIRQGDHHAEAEEVADEFLP